MMASFSIYLRRPYFAGNKKGGGITTGTYVNLHTIKSISFTKGYLIKKHLVIQKSSQTPTPTSKDSPKFTDTSSLHPNGTSLSALQTPTKRKKSEMYLEFIIRFDHVNRLNLSEEALGGTPYSQTDWWIEVESFQTFQFNIMRNNLQALCTKSNHTKLRQQVISLSPPEWLSDSQQLSFQVDHSDILDSLNDE